MWVWINIYCAYAALSRRNRRMLMNGIYKNPDVFSTCWKRYGITLLRINTVLASAAHILKLERYRED